MWPREATEAMTQIDIWAASPVNQAAILLCLILAVFTLRQFAIILPYLTEGMIRWKRLSEIESNMRLARERDMLILPSFVICIVALSAMGMLQPPSTESFGEGMKTACTIGIMTGFLAVRGIMILITPSGKGGRDVCRTANRALFDFGILTSLAYLLILLIFYRSGDYTIIARKVAYYATGFMWLLFLFRKSQILRSADNLFHTILYLCAVELLPAGLLVASIVYL